ncbi:MAG: GNAT family N-acetyltransferase [Planctomycetota bacterium]
MIHYRPFLNSDPPALAEIWRGQPASRARVQMMTPAALDDMVFCKPYFDRHGLILAIEDDKPIGFAHAGFGPNAELSGIEYRQGTTALLLVSPHHDHEVIARELLSRCEQYLRDHGAATLFGGATKTLAPFYLGLCGASQLPGVLASDAANTALFRQAGYSETTHTRVFRCNLTEFRPPMDRDLMQVRRQYSLVKQADPLPQNWWEACAFAATERHDFVLLPKANGAPVAEAKFWDMQPLASSWGVHARGLVSLKVSASSSEIAIATHFVSEIFRQFQGVGVTVVEFQLHPDETLAIEVCRKLGFDEVDQGLLFQKPTTL